MTVSECHGVLTGLIAASKTINHESWLEHILEDQQGIEHIVEEDRAMLAKWYEHTSTGLSAEDFSFTLCLPDDEQPMQDRLSALVDWCHGFLYGFGSYW